MKNKVVLITGASRGIGRATARMFASAGARVALHYHRNSTAMEETLKGLAGSGHEVFQADLGAAAQAERLVQSVLVSMKKIDILVNNAGVFEDHPLPSTDFPTWVKAWERTVGTNLFGAAHVSYCAARAMIEQGGGKIINITSRGAFRGEPDAPAYGASKAGMNAMSQSLAKALAPYGILVYAIAPGWVDTEMAASVLKGPDAASVRNQSPLGRVADPEEIARTVLFLAGSGTDALTGCIIDVNGASYLRS